MGFTALNPSYFLVFRGERRHEHDKTRRLSLPSRRQPAGGEPDRAHRLSHMVPMKRVGTADEIANAIVWLMSDDASYVTSAILDVSGGR